MWHFKKFCLTLNLTKIGKITKALLYNITKCMYKETPVILEQIGRGSRAHMYFMATFGDVKEKTLKVCNEDLN